MAGDGAMPASAYVCWAMSNLACVPTWVGATGLPAAMPTLVSLDQFQNRWLRSYRGAADVTRACGAT
jgi:hypothetical protein